jgi:ferrous iron transport protein B
VFSVLDGVHREPHSLKWAGDVEDGIRSMEDALPPDFPIVGNRRFMAVKLLETGGLACGEFLGEIDPALKDRLINIRRIIEGRRNMPAYEIIAAERHHLAMKTAEESSLIHHGRKTTWDSRLDAALMHPVAGYLILAAVFVAFFVIIFKVGQPLENLLLDPFGRLGAVLAARMGHSLLFYLAEGLLQGIGGGVAIVFPYFLPLLFLMALLEDLGYLARAGFLLDAFLHRIGLHGKSVSPFVLGFGCNVPAIVSTRILESQRDRILTSLLIPFIPCSARTTIILALVAFYLGPFWALGFYAGNILLVAVLGWAISLFLREPSPGLILEIPSLKVPTLRNIYRKIWMQLSSFIKFAWPLLVGGSIALSLLTYFRADRVINGILAPLVVKGLGLPRELGVTLIFGFLRKELSLIMMLQALGVDYRNLLTVVTREQLIVFTVFISLFIPCLSTFAILWKEIGRKWALLSAALSVGVALALSWVVRLILG